MQEHKRRFIDLINRHYILWTLIKIIFVLLLLLALLAIGAMIGYGVIGGGKPTDVFDSEVWEHIFDFF